MKISVAGKLIDAQPIIDSGERQYTPGNCPREITIADGVGPHILYDNRTQVGGGTPDINGNYGNGAAYRIRRWYVMAIPQGEENTPAIRVKLLDASGALLKILDIAGGGNSERYYYDAPANSRVVVELSLAARVVARATIQEL